MKNTRRRAALHNLGCKVNAYETEAMRQLLSDAGYEIVPFEETADVYVINTCSVTNIADRKSRQMLHRAKKRNPAAAVVAAGCYVQTAKENTNLPVEADILIGNNRKQDLIILLEEFFAGQGKLVERVTDLAHSREYEELSVRATREHTRAFIKVQDGCDQFCSYCLIPYARGRARSRESAQVIREAEGLARAGVRELVLTGIHLSSYGKDFKEAGSEGAGDLMELIREVSKVPGIERIRLGSLEPRIVTEKFARDLAQIGKVCPQFHLSLQSGSDAVLRRMNRHYSAQQFYEAAVRLREAFSLPALTTDVIAGFPGETQEEFEETVRFLERIHFYETHIFRYSRREGTAAAALPGHLPERVKAERSAILIRLGEQNRRSYEEEWIGRPCSALFEERQEIGGKGYFTGHTREYIRCFIPADQDYTNAVLSGSLSRMEGGEAGEDLLLFVPGCGESA